MLDPGTERELVRSWLVSLGLNQANDMSSAAITLVEALLLANILETLWLVPNSRWFEERFDYMSVRAAAVGVLVASGMGAGARAAALDDAGWRRRAAAARARASAALARAWAHIRMHARHNAALV
jgi:hypothetical protein